MKIREYNVQGKIYKMQLFDKITTNEQAYLIGYLLGDGGFMKGSHKRKSRMFVTSIEEYIIKHFQEEFCPDNNINSTIPLNNVRPNINTTKVSYMLQFPSKFYDTFNKFGILGLKTERTYHNIKKDYMNNLLLGLFDSDGCITWGKRKDRDRLWCSFFITHPNLKMLEKLQEFLADEVGVTTQIRPKGTEKCYILRTSKRENVYKILQYIYSNKPKVYNISKYKNSNEFIKTYINYEYKK